MRSDYIIRLVTPTIDTNKSKKLKLTRKQIQETQTHHANFLDQLLLPFKFYGTDM